MAETIKQRLEREAKEARARMPKKGLMDYYLGGTGIPERLGALNQLLNPVEAIGQSMQASRDMVAPNRTGWERTASLGDMLSGVAGVVAPVAGASSKGAGKAISEALTGIGGAVDDAALPARMFAADESGALRLYHGSPYDFDRFSMDKIGTGSGEQAYGQGLYFAESPETAKWYRDYYSDGRKFLDSFDFSKKELENKAANASMELRLLEIRGGTKREKEAATKALKQAKSELNDFLSQSPPSNMGRLYEANVDANTDDFIDYDAPIAENARLKEIINENLLPIVGKDGLNRYWKTAPENGKAIPYAETALPKGQLSQALKNAGFKGVKFKDRDVEGSSNYVVFDDRLIDILGKDGVRNTPEGKAQNVLDMLQSGRGAEVTDEMLDLGEPVANARLNEYLYKNYDLPMDAQSRAARAGEMGFADTPLYHGTGADFTGFKQSRKNSFLAPNGVYLAGDGPLGKGAVEASGYANDAGVGANVLPVFDRAPQGVSFSPLDGGHETMRELQNSTMASLGLDRSQMNKVWDAIENKISAGAYNSQRTPSDYDQGSYAKRVVVDPANIRSQFARFDPRLSHLRNLSAGVAGVGVVGAGMAPSEADAMTGGGGNDQVGGGAVGDTMAGEPIQIQAPDGSIVQFPAGTTDDVITSVMQREYGGPAQNTVANVAAQAGAGTQSGIANILGFPVDAMASLYNKAANLTPDGLQPIENPFLGSQSIYGMMAPFRQGIPEPQTDTERFARRVGQEVGAGAVTAPIAAAAAPARAGSAAIADLLSSFGGGVGAATANQIAPDSVAAEIAGSLAGGIGAGMGASRAMGLGSGPVVRSGIDEQADIASDAYGAVRADRRVLPQENVDDFAMNLLERVTKEKLNPRLQPNSAAILDAILQDTANPMRIEDIEDLRRLTTRGVAATASPDDARMAKIMTNEITDYLDNLGDPIADRLKEGRDAYRRGMAAQAVEAAVGKATRRAASTGSGGNEINAIRQNLRAILDNPRKARSFKPDELAAIEQVVMGTADQNAMRRLSRFAPSSGGLSSMLGIGGAMASPQIALPIMAVTEGAKALGERSTRMGVDKILQSLARDRIMAPRNQTPSQILQMLNMTRAMAQQ